MHDLLHILINTTLQMGYLGFFFYMIIVGTFIPLPTQLILLPAGYLIFEGKLNFVNVTIITTLGATIGASINYTFASYISHKFISTSKIKIVNTFFKRYGKVSVFLAPLTPGMGQYISIPAGIAKMELKWFLSLIFISNLIWNMLMLSIGYYFGQNANNIAKTLGWVIFSFIIISTLLYYIRRNK